MNEKLHEYAALLIRIGLNIQKGQRLVISSPVECAYFARLCAEEAYAAGCREVVMNWHDDAMARLKYLYADDEIFDTVPLWRRHFFNDHALEGAAYLAISASDPENFRGVEHSRIVRAQQASGKALKDFDRLSECAAASPDACLGAHSQLGQNRLPRRQRGRSHGKALGCHFRLRPHQR